MRRSIVLIATLGIVLAISPSGSADEKKAARAGPASKPGKVPGKADEERLRAELLKKVSVSSQVRSGWMVEGPSYVVHSSISPEYTAAAAARLHRFHEVFRSIFRGEFKEGQKPLAYGFATQKEYMRFSPDSYGTWGRFKASPDEKDLAWFSLPAGEKDFYKTDFTVVQHEASHQLLHGYTGNPILPSWFNEGVATFFEEWDLDKKNEENILAGVSGKRGLGIALSYPGQSPPAPLEKSWILPRDVLNLRKFDQLKRPDRWPPQEGRVDSFFKHRLVAQEYDESWCVLTFLIDHKVGQEVFKLFVNEFREGKNLDEIKARYFDEKFLSSFEKEWRKFIETKVLPHWRLPTAGGKTLLAGDSRPPPKEVGGVPLTADRRGDAFLVDVESRALDFPGGRQEVRMLRAWSMPLKLYEEAWAAAPGLLEGKRERMVGDVYEAFVLRVGAGRTSEAIFLFPAWVELPLEGFWEAAAKAASELPVHRPGDGDEKVKKSETPGKAKAKAGPSKG